MSERQPQSVLTRIPAGYKFAFLFVAALSLYLVSALAFQMSMFAAAIAALVLTRTPFFQAVRLLSGLVLIAALVFVAMTFSFSWQHASMSTIRLLSLCLFAYSVTLTTRFSEMLALFERFLRPTRHLGLRPAQMSLALSMTVRFIPEIRTRYLEVREAQLARGLHNNPIAVLIPLLVRTLHSTQEISDALDARCYDSGDSHPHENL